MRLAGALLAASVVGVVVVRQPLIATVVGLVAVVTASALDHRAVRSTLRAGFVLAIVFAAAVTAAVVAWAHGAGRGIESGALVLLRLVVLATAAAVLARRVDAERILRASQRLGMERLGLVLGLALNCLPRIAEASAGVWDASGMRSRGRLGRVRQLPALGEVLLAHTARIADEAAAAAALRGHRALTASEPRLETSVRTVVVTGSTNSGKTAALIAGVERLRRLGRAVAGFVQTAEWEGDRKVGFDVLDLQSGDTAKLATRVEAGSGRHGTSFRFSDEGFDLGRAALRRARPGCVVVVDELGPVELRGGGHMPAVREALGVPDLAAILVVVRRTLVPSLLAALEASDAIVIDVGDRSDDTVSAIVEATIGEIDVLD
jgi:nucleoside-triphosphatase THEP1/energy-coupling factor transporter transmembrane protein EcfT